MIKHDFIASSLIWIKELNEYRPLYHTNALKLLSDVE